MKNIFIIFLSIGISLSLTSCIKTGSNYEYSSNSDKITTEDSENDTNAPETIISDLATTVQTPETINKEPPYEYMDFDGWEYPLNSSAKTYFYSSDLIFEENDIVPVDEVISYFTLFEMINESTYELHDSLIQYRTHTTGDSYKEQNEICIPKEIVNSVIEKHFAIEVDDSNSKYTHPERNDCYLLLPTTSGNMGVVVKDYVTDGERSTAIYSLYDSIDKKIFCKAEICIENENSKEDFKIIYVRVID